MSLEVRMFKSAIDVIKYINDNGISEDNISKLSGWNVTTGYYDLYYWVA